MDVEPSPAAGAAQEPHSTYLFIINNAPYGDERPYNALRLARGLVRQDGVRVRVYLIGDGVLCAKRNQRTPDGYYNLGRMLESVARRGEVAT